MQTIRLTLAQAIVRFLIAQKIDDDGEILPLFAGVHAIFGHGNVTCLGTALEEVQDQLPTYRGQNEQSMALAAVAYARARRRKQIHVCSASVGPGSANMVTAAGVAMSDRLPVLFLCGDSFATRLPDPVLQQVEHFHDLTITTNDAFKAVIGVLRPDRPAGAGPLFAAPGRGADARSSRVRSGDVLLGAGRCKARRSTIRPTSSTTASIAFHAIRPPTINWTRRRRSSARQSAR